MEEVLHFQKYKIKERKYIKKDLKCSIVFKILNILISSIALTLFVFSNKGLMNIGLFFTYLEFDVNILIILISLIFLMLDLVFLVTKKDYSKRWLYFLKFIILGGSFNAFFFFIPTFITMVLNISDPLVIASYIFSSVLSFIAFTLDFVINDYSFTTRRYHIYLLFIIPIIYIGIIVILSFGFNIYWPLYLSGNILKDSCAPYPFLNYEINTWFNNKFTFSEFKDGHYGFSTFYMLFWTIPFNLICGFFVLKTKNNRLIKKYNLKVSNNSYYQEI